MQRHHKSNSVSRASATPCVPGEHSRFCARYEQRACTYVTGRRMCCAWLFSRRPAVLSQRTGEARKGRRAPQPVSHARVPCPRVSVLGEPQRNGNALSMPSGRHDHTCPQAFPYPYGTVEGPGERAGHGGRAPLPSGILHESCSPPSRQPWPQEKESPCA